ncbi:MAG: glycosyltransferase [Bacteroidales bacterium]|nr:glycosyltransferase [Bacteroidales bacterium]
MKNLANKNILITGLQSWDIEIGSNCKNIAQEFSKNNQVIYVNPPENRISWLKRKWNQKSSKVQKGILRKVNQNLWVYTPKCIRESISRLPSNIFFDILNKYNNRIFAKEIKDVLQKLEIRDFIHFCDSDIFHSFYLKELLQPSSYIYYTRDNLLAVNYWQVQGKRIEPLHMKKADIVLANSNKLAQLAAIHNSNSYNIGQGCDLNAFLNPSLTIPGDIKDIHGPKIGYIGTLTSLRIDENILYYIATSRPDWNLVLVGPEDMLFQRSNLHFLSNVHFLGLKNEKELPAYLQSFDVAINPQKLNEITLGNYPRKIDEYLAMGKPVVATNTPAMEMFGDYVALAKNRMDWIRHIQLALDETDYAKNLERIEFAKSHSWENNVKQIYGHIAC